MNVFCLFIRQIFKKRFKWKIISKVIMIVLATLFIFFIYNYNSVYNSHTCKERKKIITNNSELDKISHVIDKWWSLSSKGFKPDCNYLLSRNVDDDVFLAAKMWNPIIPDEDSFCSWTCDEIINHFGFRKHPATNIEADYPMAFVFMGQRNIFQTLTLFRLIYWPQNVYCLNWDAKSSPKYINTFRKLVSCFPNVITPENHWKIYWGEYSLLQATMDCVKLLDSYHNISWNYMQIVSWNDFPLKTNYEMVQILKILNGANDVGLELAHMNYIYKKCDPYEVKDCNPPGSVVFYKGSYAVTLSREFVRFIVTNKYATDLYAWLKGTWCAEEHYWSTLNHNSHLNPPGGYPGWCLQFYSFNNYSKPEITRLQQWSETKPCKGKAVKGSCVYSVYNLNEIVHANYLWAHKVYQEYQPTTIYCLQKWFLDKLNNSKTNLSASQLSYYANLSFVKSHNSMKTSEC